MTAKSPGKPYERERKEIADKLHQHYLDTHLGYKEPIRQLEIEF